MKRRESSNGPAQREQGQILVGGVIYLPTAKFDLGGNGPLGAIQVIADTAKIHGPADMDVDFTAYIDIPLKTVVKLTE